MLEIKLSGRCVDFSKTQMFVSPFFYLSLSPSLSLYLLFLRVPKDLLAPLDLLELEAWL